MNEIIKKEIQLIKLQLAKNIYSFESCRTLHYYLISLNKRLK